MVLIKGIISTECSLCKVDGLHWVGWSLICIIIRSCSVAAICWVVVPRLVCRGIESINVCRRLAAFIWTCCWWNYRWPVLDSRFFIRFFDGVAVATVVRACLSSLSSSCPFQWGRFPSFLVILPTYVVGPNPQICVRVNGLSSFFGWRGLCRSCRRLDFVRTSSIVWPCCCVALPDMLNFCKIAGFPAIVSSCVPLTYAGVGGQAFQWHPFWWIQHVPSSQSQTSTRSQGYNSCWFPLPAFWGLRSSHMPLNSAPTSVYAWQTFQTFLAIPSPSSLAPSFGYTHNTSDPLLSQLGQQCS